jgi:hypothetical protein
MFWHDQNATEFIDLSGEASRLRLQHIHRETLMSVLHELGDAIIKRGELAKQPVKLLLDRRAPSLRFWIWKRFLFFRAHRGN